MNITITTHLIVILALIMTLVHAQSDIVHLPCRDPDNFDPSTCLFAGDHCDFNANFSLFYDQAMPYYKYVQNPIPEHAEFVIESGVPRIDNGTLTVSLIPPKDASKTGVATIISTTRFLHYGLFEGRFKVSGHAGTVTSFIGFSNLKDEIDLEITGYDNVSVETNWYYRGMADVFASNGSSVNGYIGKTNESTSEFYHTYMINWTNDSIIWFINGQIMHKSLKANAGKKGFPDTPMRISFGIWQAQENSTWAGPSNIIDWSNPISTTFQSLRVSCLAGPHNNTNVTGEQLTHASTGYNPDNPDYTASAASFNIVTTIMAFLIAMLALII